MAIDAVGLAGLLADSTRRRVVSALVLGDRTVEQIRESTGLESGAIVKALSRLIDGELVLPGRDRDYVVIEEAFVAAARSAAPPPDRDEHADAPTEEARVLRSFVRDGRLQSIPTQHSKRLVVLNRLAQEFDPGRRYPEQEVNAILRRWHDDSAALRRYLVDDGFMERASGEYWRAGGTFEP
ncbi:MAG TPA: DUF2087 domain-containing protein [Acidimicrobiales bacterium]